MRSGWSDEGLLLLGSFHDSLIARSLSRGVAREGWVCQRSQVVSGQSLESVTWHWHQAPTWHGAHSHWESGDCRGWEPLDHGYIEDRTSAHIVDNLQRSELIWGKTHPYWYISFVCFYPRNSSSGASGLAISPCGGSWVDSGLRQPGSAHSTPARHRLTIGTNQELLIKIISSHLYCRTFLFN